MPMGCKSPVGFFVARIRKEDYTVTFRNVSLRTHRIEAPFLRFI